MSLLLEFRTPQNREANSAGIRTNLCFPTITPPTDATDCKGGTTVRLHGKSHEGLPIHRTPKAIPAHSVSRSPDRELYTSELPVNDLLTNSGNSD